MLICLSFDAELDAGCSHCQRIHDSKVIHFGSCQLEITSCVRIFQFLHMALVLLLAPQIHVCLDIHPLSLHALLRLPGS